MNPALSTDEILAAVTDTVTLPHPIGPHHDYRPNCSCGDVEQLVTLLRQVGIEPTEAARYDALAAVKSRQPPLLDDGIRLLDLTTAELEKRLTDLSVTAAVHEQWSLIAGEARHHLELELRESMRTEVNAYINALKPAFAEAFGLFLEAVNLGVTPSTGIEQAITLEPTAQAMWRLLNSGVTARALDGLLGLRIRMTTALRLDSNLAEDGYASVIGCDAGIFTREYPSDWQRWLTVAQGYPAAQLADGDL